jgi:Zn finger protein HypA/HybF involved in hydrogenase expression
VHELSLAMEICRMAEQRLAPAQLPQLVEVGVEVGDDAGVEADNLQFCLEALLQQPPFLKAAAVVRRTKGDALRLEYLEIDDGRPDDRGP